MLAGIVFLISIDSIAQHCGDRAQTVNAESVTTTMQQTTMKKTVVTIKLSLQPQEPLYITCLKVMKKLIWVM